MNRSLAAALLCTLGALSLPAAADTSAHSRQPGRTFEVTVTNLTRGQSFTPLLFATHTRRIAAFELGEPASSELAILAEAGDTAPLTSALASSGQVLDAKSTSGLLAPGASVTVRVRASARFDRLTVAAMLIPTNDSFVALNSLELPWHQAQVSRTLLAYDAGSEPNDEVCANIPGPTCGGTGASPAAGGEGYVHVSAGIHGVGDLAPATYDWRNPVARVVIRRVD